VNRAGRNWGVSALFFAAGAIWLVVALRNDFQALYFVTSGLSVLAGTINLFNYLKARNSDDESGKGSPD